MGLCVFQRGGEACCKRAEPAIGGSGRRGGIETQALVEADGLIEIRGGDGV